MSPSELTPELLRIPKALSYGFAKGDRQLREELESAGYEELVKSSYRYTPIHDGKEIKPLTYFFSCVKWRLYKEMEKYKRKKSHEAFSLNNLDALRRKGIWVYEGMDKDAPGYIDSAQRDPAEIAAAKDELETLLSHMPENRRKEVELLAEGYNVAELAREQGINRFTCAKRLAKAKEKALGKVYPMYLHFRIGSRVRLVTPENARLHNATARITALEEWGAHVSCDAAGAKKFRALWEEMQPVEFLNGEVAMMTNAEIETVVDVSEKALRNGEVNGETKKGLAEGRSKDLGYTGDTCDLCGSLQMRRIGTCLLCEGCNTTTGCG